MYITYIIIYNTIHTSYSVIHLCFLFGYMHGSTSDGQEVPSWASCRRGFWWRCRNPGWMEVSYGGTPSYRRKVSQTSDRCSSGESSQRRVRRERGLRERVGRKKIKVRGKVEKSRNTVFFQCFVAAGGRKVGSLKRRVRSHVAGWVIKNCRPLWREAVLEVKKLKTLKALYSGTTFGSCDVRKLHAAVARSTYRSQNVQNSPAPEHFCNLRCWKRCGCGAKHVWKLTWELRWKERACSVEGQETAQIDWGELLWEWAGSVDGQETAE